MYHFKLCRSKYRKLRIKKNIAMILFKDYRYIITLNNKNM